MRNNKGQFKKSHIPYSKGKSGVFSSDHIKKLSESHKGKKQSTETKQKRRKSLKKAYTNGKRNTIPPSQKGKKRTKETCIKIGNSKRGHIKTIETRMKMSNSMKGKNSKGGITKLNVKIRGSIEFRLWRESVFARDNWTCQKYKVKGGKLNAHHIKNFSDYPKLRFAIDNGITLSEKAHRGFHKKYGVKKNTKKQLLEFIK